VGLSVSYGVRSNWGETYSEILVVEIGEDGYHLVHMSEGGDEGADELASSEVME
jgi:hypothetical protein